MANKIDKIDTHVTTNLIFWKPKQWVWYQSQYILLPLDSKPLSQKLTVIEGKGNCHHHH